jgi:hypothetical protein
VTIEEKKDETPAPPPGARNRGGCLAAFLVAMMIINPLVAILYLAAGSTISKNLPDAPTWAIPVLGIFCIVNFAGAIALWRWKKWGFYAFVVSALVALVVNIMIGIPLFQVIWGPLGVVILYALVRRVWDELEPGV